MPVLEKYANYLPAQYSNYPRGYYVSLILLRKVEGEAIFRTEGSGEPLNREFVHAGATAATPVIPRVVISKRKQTAVERRTGRELLRRLELLAADAGLNEGNPEPDSIDSMLYGYAVGGGGAQKSRVITDDAFTILPATQVVGKRQFNAPFEDGTMRHPVTKDPSSSIGTDEYVRPETHFIDIETLKDVTPGEFLYVLGNILRSSRYGAISSRVGKIHNEVLACIFSDCELFSNLELTQQTWDLLCINGNEPDFPLADEAVAKAIQQAVATLQTQVYGRVTPLPATDLQALLTEVQQIYSEETQIKALLTSVQAMYKK
ncbi:MAG: type I-D CRISPR-associated protein Cas7/Csc2 [Caldilineaceae bacterium]|nr:type I-D CRISPR-associated protein Cas7/Csc2 [Caldilineaceae bacterium]